jgi:dTDP-4-dehydrorhamnose reductase
VQAAADLAGLPFQAEATTRAALGGAFRPARSCLDSDRFAQAFGLRLPDWRLALAEALSIRGRSAQTP